MSDSASLLARIENLEIHMAHQDDQIESLGETIEKQWREIDRLSLALKQFTGRLQAVEEAVPDGGPDAPPPHY
ncbi:MAG: SlyX protein [Rhizobiales bacterium]|nr:SlyX protein [Hyphomicrobiales bacterium]